MPTRGCLVFILCQWRWSGRLISRTSSAVTIFAFGLIIARMAFIRVVLPEKVSPTMSMFELFSWRSQKYAAIREVSVLW